MSLKKTKKEPEKRIYVIVPRYAVPKTVKDPFVKMECGRLMAQVAHVVSKLKLRLKSDPDIEFTTIILQVETSVELLAWALRVQAIVSHNPKALQYEVFEDANEEFYGTPDHVITGLAIMTTRKQGKKHFHLLNPWHCELEK